MKITVVYNPKSGSGLSRAQIKQLCDKNAIEVTAFITLSRSFESRLKPYLTKDAYIAVIGGDGTIGAVSDLLVHTKAILIPLPGGTLNHFTKDLGVPQTVDEALAGLSSKRVRQVDVASLNDTVFINNSSLGLYPMSLRERTKIEPSIGKWPAAVWATVVSIAKLRMLRLSIDGVNYRTPFVFVGNNQYTMSGLQRGQRRKLDEGHLSLIVARTTRRARLFRLGLHLITRKKSTTRDLVRSQPIACTISSTVRTLSVSCDDEIRQLSPPLKYTIHEKALRVLA